LDWELNGGPDIVIVDEKTNEEADLVNESR
jgi:hypothetical protein